MSSSGGSNKKKEGLDMVSSSGGSKVLSERRRSKRKKKKPEWMTSEDYVYMAVIPIIRDKDTSSCAEALQSNIRTLLAVAAAEKLELDQFNVKTAFLDGVREEDVYVEQAERFEDGTGRVCLLKKSLHGLKQPTCNWKKRFLDFMMKSGFKNSDPNPCLFYHQSNKNCLHVAICAYDDLVVGSNRADIEEFMKVLKLEFHTTRGSLNNLFGWIQNNEGCCISFEEAVNEEVVHNELEIDADKSVHFAMISFPSKYQLLMHVFIHIDGVQPPIYICKSCGEVFPSNNKLIEHLEISNGDQDLTPVNNEEFDYSDCHKNFVLEDNVNDHTVLLTAKRLHKCDVCGKSFIRLAHLKRHGLTHSGMRPHKCDICGESFTLLGHLKSHSETHNGTRPHKCVICDKSFIRSRDLKRHFLTHTGKRPHKCDFCGISFTLLDSLKNHTLIHTEKKLYFVGMLRLVLRTVPHAAVTWL
ncbi:zinc finger protein 222-like [Schistocerca piceifrons]|uniref:zinc finger protein 222-like n=1 Tax=Schistocerca piceifrons TaxID=274613 RepID=UPI001F5FC00D|nr:zinc finger protein 222-like [Schistocerca piceifrons]